MLMVLLVVTFLCADVLVRCDVLSVITFFFEKGLWLGVISSDKFFPRFEVTDS